jgi:alkyl hydroperoxide reductase subunit D
VTGVQTCALPISAINGCGACLDAHESELRSHDVTNVQVQAALRIAAVVNATSRILAAENAFAVEGETAAWS